MRIVKIILYTSLSTAICLAFMPLKAIALNKIPSIQETSVQAKMPASEKGFGTKSGMFLNPRGKIDLKMIIPGDPDIDPGIFINGLTGK